MVQHHNEPEPNAGEEPSGEPLHLLELETLLDRPPALRKRLAQLGCLLLAGVVVLVVFWGTIVPGRPAAPPAPALLITSNVTAGTVTINGQKQPGGLPVLAAIHGDTYDVRLDAPPFFPKSCHVRLSQPDSTDRHTCLGISRSQTAPVRIKGVSVALAFELDIFLTPDDLPPAQQSQVTSLLTRAVHAQQDVLVPAGAYFATSGDFSGKPANQRATTPLAASASVDPFTPRSSGVFLLCSGFTCTGDFKTLAAPAFHDQRWGIQVLVALRWRFRSASHAIISKAAFQPEQNVSLFLAFKGAAGWVVSPNPSPPGTLATQVASTVCLTGQAILSHVAGANASMTIRTAYDRRVEGCELVLEGSGVEEGRFLWRIGVLLAADAQAHVSYPELPVAPPEELAAVETP